MCHSTLRRKHPCARRGHRNLLHSGEALPQGVDEPGAVRRPAAPYVKYVVKPRGLVSATALPLPSYCVCATCPTASICAHTRPALSYLDYLCMGSAS